MALPDVGSVLEEEFVIRMIDYDRSSGAKEIEKAYIEKEQGLPWFAFLRPDGTAIVNSTGPKGNVGMPWQPDEVDHFKTMLQTAKKHLTDAQIDALIESIKDFRKKTGG